MSSHTNRPARSTLLWRLAFAAGLACNATAFAQPVDSSFTYRADLANGGTPANGIFDLRFRLYDASLGGLQVGPELCANDLAAVAGRVSTTLDFGNVFGANRFYLEVDVRSDTGNDCTNPSGWTTLAPRQPIGTAPYAAYSLSAATATSAANTILFGGQDSTFYRNAANLTGTLTSGSLAGTYSSVLNLSNAGNVLAGNGAGLTALNAASLSTGTIPSARLSGTYSNALTLSNAGNVLSGNGAALTALNAASLSTGTIPSARLSGTYSNALTLSNAGNVLSGNGAGLTALNAAALSTGTVADARLSANVARLNASNSFTVGPTAFSGQVAIGIATPDDTSLHAFTSSRTTAATVETSLAGGIGLSAVATATTGASIAGSFVTSSTTGTGVYSLASANSGVSYAIHGSNDSGSANAIAVRGEATRTGANFGVYGSAGGASSFGVYANGRLGSSGTKSFMIDHPLDPENKYLLHYSVESPDVLNVYTGIANLDSSGEAWVTLPDYFEAINTEPRYLLTSIGAPAPLLHIAVEVDKNTFKIAGGAPNAKVSWEIKAKRNDNFVQRYGAPVERVKIEGEKGLYLRPELYDLPANKGQFQSVVSPVSR